MNTTRNDILTREPTTILHTKTAKGSGIGNYKVMLGNKEIARLYGTRAIDMEGKAIIHCRDNEIDRGLLTIIGF